MEGAGAGAGHHPGVPRHAAGEITSRDRPEPWRPRDPVPELHRVRVHDAVVGLCPHGRRGAMFTCIEEPRRRHGGRRQHECQGARPSPPDEQAAESREDDGDADCPREEGERGDRSAEQRTQQGPDPSPVTQRALDHDDGGEREQREDALGHDGRGGEKDEGRVNRRGQRDEPRRGEGEALIPAAVPDGEPGDGAHGRDGDRLQEYDVPGKTRCHAEHERQEQREAGRVDRGDAGGGKVGQRVALAGRERPRQEHIPSVVGEEAAHVIESRQIGEPDDREQREPACADRWRALNPVGSRSAT